jgi:hypothetical protein
MNPAHAYAAIYDFALLPYALGDVLTWNVQTAIRAAEAGRGQVDVYICADPRYPSNIYQRGLVVEENSFLYFNELLGAFGTHPSLGNIHVFTSRDQMLERLRALSESDAVVLEAVHDYETTLGNSDSLDTHNNIYFRKYIYSHAKLNEYHAQRGAIPLLVASRGCEPDVEGVMTRLLGGKRVVVIHPRLRRLDHGMGGDHTYRRDSDFLEWHEFLRGAAINHPEVQFVVVGRLQEKPLELLRLANVTNLRTLGLGLGHELTLMQRADLFIGTSSGFAAMANFSSVPYFITRMTKGSCDAYAIPDGASSLPFAAPNQILVYDEETAALLKTLLEKGLSLPPRGAPRSGPTRQTEIDPAEFSSSRGAWLSANATTGRFFTDDDYADQEAAFLVAPRIADAAEALGMGDVAKAGEIARRVNASFPRLSARYAPLRVLSELAVPSLPRQLLARVRHLLRRVLAHGRSRLLSINGQMLPRTLRGSAVHNIARGMKAVVLGYRRV